MCSANCHLPVWVKTAETDSRFHVYGNTFARSPFYEQIVLKPGCVIYVDGVNRVQLLKGRKRREIQFGELPVWYYGQKLSQNHFAQLEATQKAINSRKIAILHDSTQVALDLFNQAKPERVRKFARDFIQKARSNDGYSFDPDNHALWPERAPGFYAMLNAVRNG